MHMFILRKPSIYFSKCTEMINTYYGTRNDSEQREKGNPYLSLEILAGTQVSTLLRIFLLLVPMLPKPTGGDCTPWSPSP